MQPEARSVYAPALRVPRANRSGHVAHVLLLGEGIHLGSSVHLHPGRCARPGRQGAPRAEPFTRRPSSPSRPATGPNQIYSGTSPSCTARESHPLPPVRDPRIHSRYAVGWMVATCESAGRRRS